MDERAGFVRAICAEPADDIPRLVYADWLQEHDEEERAEFIRVQCELEITRCTKPVYQQIFDHDRYGNMPVDHFYNPCGKCKSCLRFGELYRRARELRGPHETGSWGKNEWEWWARELSGKFSPFTVCRGFVSEITCTAEDFLKHADALIWHPDQNRPCPATAQPITKVTLTTVPHVHEHGEVFSKRLVWLSGRQGYAWRNLLHRPDLLEYHGLPGATALALLSAEWPGIEFVLPEPAPHELLQDYADELHTQMMHALGIPPT